jgi:HAD superfamily 5'-nucleotidase-like hydrolase
MTLFRNADTVHVIEPLDLSAIDAVGFDMDHTLALYDDQAVNVLAAEETVHRLKLRGHVPGTLPLEIIATVARGLSMDLGHGNILKIASNGRVLLARHGASWLPDREIANVYGGYNPANEATTWHVHSPFDAPTLWFFSVLGPGIRTATDTEFAARLLRDIRTALDESHTHGELKRHIVRDMSRFVSAAGPLEGGLRAWKEAGKRLFVVTNSDRAYATRVLDHVLGDEWRVIFDFVVTDAHKPRFFADVPPPHAPRMERDGISRVLDGATASMVETEFGVAPGRILYAGDNARADIIPARRRGWKAIQVVAELAARPGQTPWAGALSHDGAATWFARTIHEHAHGACARIDALLAQDPAGRLDRGVPFLARVAGAPAGDAA